MGVKSKGKTEWHFSARSEIVRLIFTYLFLTLQKNVLPQGQSISFHIYNFRTSEIETS